MFDLDILRDPSSVEVHSTALLICASLCKDCKVNKKMLKSVDAVSVIISFLKFFNEIISRFKSPHKYEEEYLLLSVSECIRAAICMDMQNEAEFFCKDGLYDLLDLLEVKQGNLRKNLLNCLLDLLENPKTRFYVEEWKRKSVGGSKGIQHLLIEFWNHEEAQIMVPVLEHGILENLDSPLEGQELFNGADTSKFEFDGKVINEITLNLRVFNVTNHRLKFTLVFVNWDSRISQHLFHNTNV